MRPLQPAPIPADWVEHRRASDGECLGWLRASDTDDSWVAIDLLGRVVGEPGDLDEVEAALDDRGLGYLADRYALVPDDGGREAVRIVEVNTREVVVKAEDFGAIDRPAVLTRLPWPVGPRSLRAL